jgi:glycerol-3-phosphate cytidylyltransferase
MKRGFIAGSFDIIHPGYIAMFKEAKQHCDYLIIGLHIDPTIERPEKIKPTLNYQDRYNILMSIKYIDQIYSYELENDLFNLLKDIKPDIRFLGDDYKDKNITGGELNIPIHYFNRDHNWSTTKFKKLIAEKYYEKSSMASKRI